MLKKGLLTRPLMFTITATSLDNVNLSLVLAGKSDPRSKVKRLDDDDKTVTIPVSVSFKETW